MRQIGTIADEKQAQRIADYLLTQGMPAICESEGEHWVIWIRDENHVESARAVLDDFRQDPEAERFRAAPKQADVMRSEEVRRRIQHQKNTVEVRTQWQGPLRRRAPLVAALIGLSVFCSVVTNFGRPPQRNGQVFNTLMMADIRDMASPDAVNRDPLAKLKSGQLWRVVTPVFLHGGWIHLFFNMYWMLILGPSIEMRRGTVRFGLIALILAISGNLAQFFIGGSPFFLGMSGVVYGLFGYMWIKRIQGTDTAYPINDGTIFIMLLFLVLGFTGSLDGMTGGIANWAHLGGLLGGMAVGYVNRL